MKGQRLLSRLEKIEKHAFIKAVRGGLVMVIPVLMVGSFALILRSFPVDAYTNFIRSFAAGLLYDIFSFIYNATFGMLSVYMTIAVGFTIARESKLRTQNIYGAPISAMAALMIFTGFGTKAFDVRSFGPVGMFTAIVCATTASWLYLYFSRIRQEARLFSDGADPGFNRAIAAIIPMGATATVFALVNLLLCRIFAVKSFWELIVEMFDALFTHAGSDFAGGLLYILVSSLLWFFGIHGSDVLESVNQNIFAQAAAANEAAAAASLAGGVPTEIYTKTFFDVFVLMGGCGTLMSLLLALLLFSRRKSNRELARIAAFPMIFNINEIMVFGLPIIYNPIMFVPFILAPLASFFISGAAMGLGLVPLTTKAVEWTTPILLGGIQATGSVSGAVLQVVNLTVGVLIYMPFVRLYDAHKEQQSRENINALIDTLKDCEQTNTPVRLTELEGNSGDVAKQLVNDLRAALASEEMYLVYQPQFGNAGELVGAEALLRWRHPQFGMIYPPLIVKLADEAGELDELERRVFLRAKRDAEENGLAMRISINATAKSMRDAAFTDFIIDCFRDTAGGKTRFCVEITEQSELVTDSSMMARLKTLKEHGFLLAIDDFSMGFTSLKYLQESDFDLVKLDGELVKQLMFDNHTGEIISSIVYLSRSMGFSVLAEFVETQEQKDRLEVLGCAEYQGYLFSPAVSLEELCALTEQETARQEVH